MGCHLLLQGIFLTQGSNPCLLSFLYWQANSWPLNYLGSPNELPLKEKKAIANTWNHLPSWLVTFGFARNQYLLLKNYPTRCLQLVVTHYLTFISHTFLFLYIDSLRGRYWFFWVFQVVLMVKNPPADAGDIRMRAQSLGKMPWRKALAAHSSLLAWRIPWTESLVGHSSGVTKSQTRLRRLGTHARV